MTARKILGALCLYFNYLIHGIGVLIMSLNVHQLEAQWNTDAAGVSVVISSLGLGRLAALFLAGSLSDKYGRRPFVLTGTLIYLSFFIGLLFTRNIPTAFFFGLLAGVANSFLDAGTYPRLMELFPDAPGSAVILVKAFVAAGQFSLPLVLSLLVARDLWFGWSFVAAAAILGVNFLILLTMPQHVERLPKRMREPLAAEVAHMNEHSRVSGLGVKPADAGEPHEMSFDGARQVAVDRRAAPKRGSAVETTELVCYTLFGYTAMATFYLVSQWLAQYGEAVAGMPYADAIKLLSIYTSGSLAGVFCSSLALRTFMPPQTMLLGCTAVSTVCLVVASLFPTPEVMFAFSFVFGFSAAGGVVQLGLAMMASQFPSAKGRATGIYYSAGSISNFTIPLITAWIARNMSIHEIFKFDVIIALCGFALAVVIAVRSHRSGDVAETP